VFIASRRTATGGLMYVGNQKKREFFLIMANFFKKQLNADGGFRYTIFGGIWQ
jgi:hypothetical protein